MLDKSLGGGEPVGGSGESNSEAPVSAELLEKQKDEEDDAQAEIVELKATIAALQKELAQANEAVSMVERRAQIEQEVSRAKAVDVETACLLTEVAISEMDEPDVVVAVRELRKRKPFLFSGSGSTKSAGGSSMSAMVAQRGRGEELVGMASSARLSGDRSELLRYLRVRRGC